MDVYTTSSSKRFEKTVMEFVDHPRAEMNLIKIYPDEVYQEILGFGGALSVTRPVTLSGTKVNG